MKMDAETQRREGHCLLPRNAWSHQAQGGTHPETLQREGTWLYQNLDSGVPAPGLVKGGISVDFSHLTCGTLLWHP